MIHAIWHWLTEERSDIFWLSFDWIIGIPTFWLLTLIDGE